MDKEQKDVAGSTGKGLGRRAFVKSAGFMGLGVAGTALMAGKLGALDNMPGASALGLGSQRVEAAAITDNDILNFALNLEYLEAEFYTVAFTGRRISDFGIGTDGVGEPGPTEGGSKVNFVGDAEGGRDSNIAGRAESGSDFEGHEFSGRLTAIAQQITADEQDHVRVLRAALGKDAVAKPSIDLDALGIGFANFESFLILSRAFEDTGVSAYGGALPFIQSKTYVSVAGRIALTEALHAANVRLLVAENNIRVPRLDNRDEPPPPSGDKYFTVDSKALAIARTTSQVLAILYGSNRPGTSKGGFFPNGLNGTIKTV